MPNIRIKDIPTTASATSSTDFIGIDGSANGTRKLNAYSPTFGGNLTVNGTTGTIGSNSGFTWDLGSGINFIALSTGRPTITAAVASGNNAGAALSLLARGGGSRRTWNLETDTTEAGDFVFRQSTTEAGSTFTNALYFSAARNATLSGNLTVSGTGTSTFSGAVGVQSTASPFGSGVGQIYVREGATPTKRLFMGYDTTLDGGYIVSEQTGVANKSLYIQPGGGGTVMGGNLTVSGGTITGGTSGLSLASGGTNQNITLTPSGTGSVAFSRLVAASATAPSALAAGSGAIYFQANGSVAGTQDSWVFDTGYTDQTYRFKVAGTDRVVIAANSGNFLINTAIDGGQKLQVNGDSGFLGHLEIPADKHIYMKQGNPLRWSADGLDTGTMRADIYADSGGILYFRTNGTTAALNIDASQNATFAGTVKANGNTIVSGTGNNSAQLRVDGVSSGYSIMTWAWDASYKWHAGMTTGGNNWSIGKVTAVSTWTPYLTLDHSTGNATFSGAIAIGNTVQTAAGVASTHKVTISIGGSTYYLLATNV